MPALNKEVSLNIFSIMGCIADLQSFRWWMMLPLLPLDGTGARDVWQMKQGAVEEAGRSESDSDGSEWSSQDWTFSSLSEEVSCLVKRNLANCLLNLSFCSSFRQLLYSVEQLGNEASESEEDVRDSKSWEERLSCLGNTS